MKDHLFIKTTISLEPEGGLSRGGLLYCFLVTLRLETKETTKTR